MVTEDESRESIALGYRKIRELCCIVFEWQNQKKHEMKKDDENGHEKAVPRKSKAKMPIKVEKG